MMTEVIAHRTFSTVRTDGTYVLAKAKLYRLNSNDRPHFSLTGEEWEGPRGRKTGLLCMGAMGDTLVKDFPELAPINALHLADDTGAPMHAVENGWYWYRGDAHEWERTSSSHADPTDTPRERAARHLRIDTDRLPEGLDREQFAAFVETLRPEWQEQADAALSFLKDK